MFRLLSSSPSLFFFFEISLDLDPYHLWILIFTFMFLFVSSILYLVSVYLFKTIACI